MAFAGFNLQSSYPSTPSPGIGEAAGGDDHRLHGQSLRHRHEVDAAASDGSIGLPVLG